MSVVMAVDVARGPAVEGSELIALLSNANPNIRQDEGIEDQHRPKL
jgi:hypothetical protein